MEPQLKNCQNCKNDFTIEPDDFSFYEKIKVPPPTFCPDCRQQRRYSWRNERTLYRRNCDLCGKSTVTIYHPNSPFKVYCPPCWWGDGWDAKEFSQDFDFSRPFFDQFRELQLKAPRIALLTKNSVNSEYTNHCGDNKDCFLTFASFYSERLAYCSNLWKNAHDCVDCYMVPDAGEFLYECVDCERVYNCDHCVLVRDSTDCKYSFDLRNCSNCFLSYNLRNKSYCIYNQQYSREEYFKKLEEFKLDSNTGREHCRALFLEMLKNDPIYRSSIIERSVNSTGNFLVNCKNVKNSFDVEGSEDTKYTVGSPWMKDGMDTYHVGLSPSELYYEVHGVTRSSNVFFSHLCYDNSFIQYCDSCHNSQNLFGCVSLKKGNYLIFNKQYEKGEYEEIKNKIIEHMKKTGEYGEFFPSKYSPVSYNETQGQVYMSMNKDEAISKGFRWEENIPETKGKETILSENLPETIQEIGDSITKEVLKCISCERNYNIVFQELEFYRRQNISIPHYCPNCRYARRISLRPPRKLWHRSCMCDKAGHFHGEGNCTEEFETSYAPERPEKVFCEKCYQQEVL